MRRSGLSTSFIPSCRTKFLRFFGEAITTNDDDPISFTPVRNEADLTS
jgi:hypothetical protein